MAKTNTGLVAFCKTALNTGTGYVYGTIGQICTTDLLDQCAARYPDPNLAGGEMRTVGEKWLGKRVTDCIGLIKYYVMSTQYGANPVYVAKYDQSANATFNNATSKGVISTIPEIPGLLLHMDGHVGVYIGNGEVIEARGTVYGVVKTQLNSRPWTYWYKSTWITYTGGSSTVVDIDTTTDVTKSKGETYTFKTTSSQTPTVTVGTSGVVTLIHLRREGESDFWKLTFIGSSGQATGIFTAGPGEQPLKRFVARIA